jgi:hypothetical protein
MYMVFLPLLYGQIQLSQIEQDLQLRFAFLLAHLRMDVKAEREEARLQDKFAPARYKRIFVEHFSRPEDLEADPDL